VQALAYVVVPDTGICRSVVGRLDRRHQLQGPLLGTCCVFMPLAES
jgi:hypothetical protein